MEVHAVFLFDGGFIPVKRAENYCDMINVFTPYPLEGKFYDEFYVDTSAERSVTKYGQSRETLDGLAKINEQYFK